MKEDVEKMIMERRPIFCKECGGQLFYEGDGTYKCRDCEHIEFDDFGKIKRYLEANGPSPSTEISSGTGIALEIINIFLKNGRLEIPEGSNFYIKCERCGCALRFGRYCLKCTKELAGQLKGAFYEQMGEEPKTGSHNRDEKMHYMNHMNKR